MYGMYQIMLICGKLLLQAECCCVAGGLMLARLVYGVWCSGGCSNLRGQRRDGSSLQSPVTFTLQLGTTTMAGNIRELKWVIIRASNEPSRRSKLYHYGERPY